MTEGIDSFGRLVLQNRSVSALIDLERTANRTMKFAVLDSLIAELLVRSLRGERILTMKQNEVYENSVTISGLSPEQRDFLSASFGLEQQHARGAWFVPEKVSLSGGAANFPFYLAQEFRFPHALASLERGKVLLQSSADAIFLWALLGPLYDKLLYPFELRGELCGTLSTEDNAEAWQEVESFFNDLGFSQIAELSLLRRKWKDLADASSQLRAKRQFLIALGHTADSSIGTRYRLCSLVPLVEQYYKKAGAEGRVRRKQALTKPFQPTLSGFFQGDWLSLLDYLGEQPHPEEQIVTALPKTPLKVRGASRAAEIAAKQGITTEEVQRIAAALWQGTAGKSPVEVRIATLKKFWEAFDEIHAKQQPGMKPLWGLVEESSLAGFESNAETPYRPGLYRELIPNDLVTEIESLWGNVMLPRWPDRIVTEPFPHRLVAETFGPALLFWQSCALTAWFICEGPSSRTDMAGLAHHERRELHRLKEMKAPVDEKLFDELIKGESRLGPQEPITRDSSTTEVGHGFSITMSLSVGSRRNGFEILRDIVTRHRRTWANQYLESYLRSRWESEIREAANAFNLLLGEKGGKAPTLKQFAKSAVLATNHWFAGDVSGLYRTIGEKTPVEPTRRVLMPRDKAAFVRKVLDQLPSLQFQVYDDRISDVATQDYYRKELAKLAIDYVQLEEALGRPPQIKEIGERFSYRSKVLNADESEAWRIYGDAVQMAKVAPHEPAVIRTTTLATQAGVKPLKLPALLSSSSVETENHSEQRTGARSWIDRIFGRH